ncbi:MAG: flagellar hook-basal body complex protein FliE [Phycisphaerae bacterium]|nr:flagellar hook-basal body complex protein FliE [Phycisphaerae bacterium]
MVDPLGIIGAQQASGLSPALRPQAPAPEGQSFKDLLLDNIQKVNELQQDATHAIEDLQAGRRNDLESVLMATAKADTAFKMLLNVRNKMMDAYNEIREIRV